MKDTYFRLLLKLSVVGQVIPLLLGLTASHLAEAAHTPNVVPEGKALPAGLSVAISPGGQRYFEENFGQILEDLGVTIERVEHPALSWKAEEAVGLKDLDRWMKQFGMNSQDQQKLVKQIKGFRSFLQEILSLSQPFRASLMELDVRGISFDPEFDRMSLRLANAEDRTRSQHLLRGRSGGILVMLEFQSRQASFQIGSVDAKDVNNSFLSPLGLRNFRVFLDPKGSPMRLIIPVYARVAKGSASLEPLAIFTNLDALKLSYDRSRVQYLLPRITTTIGEGPNRLVVTQNQEVLAKKIHERIPELFPSLLKFMKRKFEADGAQMISASFEKASGPMDESVSIPAPGKPHSGRGASDADLMLKVIPTRLLSFGTQGSSEVVEIQTDLTLVDPLSRREQDWKSIWDPALSAVKPVVLPTSGYDVAFSLHPAMIQQLLRMGFDRGYFKTIDLGKHSGGLRAPPRIQISTATLLANGVLRGRMQLKLSVTPGGWQRRLFRAPIPIDLDAFVEAKILPKGLIQVSIVGLDVANATFDLSSLRMSWALAGRATRSVREAIEESHAEYVAKPETLATIPTPSFFGMNLETKRLEVRGGRLVLYTMLSKEQVIMGASR
jgi:hypothetical protein